MTQSVVLIALFFALPVGAQAPVPEGIQFQVNTYTTSSQFGSSVGVASTGASFVVVWTSRGSSGTDTDGNSVQGQRYSNINGGGPLGSQFQVNTYTTSFQSYPSVAVAPSTRPMTPSQITVSASPASRAAVAASVRGRMAHGSRVRQGRPPAAV